MNDELPVPYSKIAKYEEECVKLREKPRKKRHFLLKLTLVILLCFGFYSAFKHFDKIKGFFTSFFEKSPPIATNPGENNQDDTNGDETKNENAIISSTQSSELLNESSIDFTQITDTFSQKSLDEIYSTYGDTSPVVLIIHSMANEGYSDGSSYEMGDPLYSDTSNVASLGEKISLLLNENGINTIHISDVLNSGSFYGSRNELFSLINDTLTTYPSISYVLDISRGVAVNDDLTLSKFTFTRDGASYACIDLSLGFGNSLDENERNSFLFASLLSENIEGSRIKISELEFTPSIPACMVRIDIGTYGNSYEEAEGSAILLSDTLIKIISEKAE